MTSVPGNLVPSSGLYRYLAHTWCTYIHAHKIKKQIIKKKMFFRDIKLSKMCQNFWKVNVVPTLFYSIHLVIRYIEILE